jgi:hypothetical protein
VRRDRRVVTASDVEGYDDANEDSEVGDEDSSDNEDGGSARRFSAGGRKTLCMYFPRDSLEESSEDDSYGDAETMLLAIGLSMLSRQIRCRHQPNFQLRQYSDCVQRRAL